jgi:predicted HTH transcriptional regulator
MTALLTALGQGERSKSDLVRAIWGYSYHPLRHDPLIFQSVSRVRELLGSRAHWVESTGSGYRLRHDVRLVSLRPEEALPAPALDALERSRPRQEEPSRQGDLNFRQVRILELMRKKRFLAASECAKQFRVTEMTARRDFAALMKTGWVSRTGRARATRYELNRTYE